MAGKPKHGKYATRPYYVWQGMKQRCFNKNCKPYKNYGARGITVCDEWRYSFESFYSWAIENGYDEDAPYGECTIDRIDNDGNYEPNNCRWTNIKVQNSNKRPSKRPSLYRPVKMFGFDGRLIKRYDSISEASKDVGTPTSDIIMVCQGKKKTYKGHIWRYADEVGEIISVEFLNKTPILYDVYENGVFIMRGTVDEISRRFNVKPSTVKDWATPRNAARNAARVAIRVK